MFLTYMSISVVGQENDGTYNYLLITKSKLNRKSISISTKQVIPYKLGEEFIGYVYGECTDTMTINESYVTNKEYLCLADRVVTNKGVYE